MVMKRSQALIRSTMDEELRILAVSPYEGLAAILEREARRYENVSMSIVVGNLEEGVRAAIDRLTEPFDLIISRGGTADLLRQELDLPVADIKTSPFDILQAVQLSEGISGKRAVVGFPGIADAAHKTGEFMQLDLDVFTLVDEHDVHDIIGTLRKGGYETILCDVISSTVFRENGFNTVLVTSGAESVRESIDEAVRIARHVKSARAESIYLRQIISQAQEDVVIFRGDGSVFFTTMDHGRNELLISSLRELIPSALEGEADVVRRTVAGKQYTVRSYACPGVSGPTVAFYVSLRRTSPGPQQTGITYLTKEDARKEYLESPFSLTGDINSLKRTIDGVGRSGHPLLVTGEYGTGRTAVACYSYINSDKASHPLAEIDCGMLTERSRGHLLGSKSSPIFATGETVHIKNMDASDRAFLTELFSTIICSDTYRNNNLIFSCNPRGELVGEVISYIKDKFQCIEVELQPLRESKERIGVLARLYLSQLNADLPRDVQRIDRQAMALLSDYPWPGNYIQFKRVLSQLCIVSRDHTIRAADVRSILSLERPVYQHGDSQPMDGELDLEQPLSRIEHDIVDIVVRRNGGNQSAAARQLGISRTTLWRILKQS